MKRPSSLVFFRRFLILTLIVGVLLVVVFFLPFETIANRLNNLAADGNFETFTFEHYQTISKVTGLLGLVLTIASGFALIKWMETQKSVAKISTQIHDFNMSLRNDMRAFFDGLSTSTWNRTELALMLGLVIVALIMRLANLNIPLIHDEAYTYNAFASRSLWVTISNYHLPNNHVFLTIIINILTHLFGNHLWLIRLPTIVAGTLMVPAAYALGKRIYSKETGLLGAALVAVFPILVEYSVLARGYILMGLDTLVLMALGDRVRRNKDRFAWLLMIIAAALGFFTIPIVLFPFGALYIWLFLSCMLGDMEGYRSRVEFLKYWLFAGFTSMGLTAVLYLPILINNAALFFGNRFVEPVRWDLFPITLQSRLELTWMEWFAVIPGWLVTLGVVGLMVGLILHGKISKQKIPMQIAFVVWIAVFLIARRPSMMSRMWLFLAAPLLIWSAGGIVETLKLLSGLIKKELPLAKIFVSVAVLSVFLLCAFTLPAIPGRWAQKSSIETTALYLRDNLRDGDLVNAVTAYFPQLRYYFEVYNIPHEYLRRSGSFDRAFLVIEEHGKETLDSIIPVDGANHPLVDMDTLRIVLDLDNLIVYEGDPAP